MPFSTIDSPKKYFDTKLYTGTGSTQSIGGLSFKPDLTWLKIRNQAYDHAVQDAVRGATKDLETSSTDAEQTRSMLTAFTSDGFTLGTDSQSNSNGNTFVSWNFLGANTTVSNTSGTISSTVSANTTSGFSIVSFDLTGQTGVKTVGHGLGTAPKVVITKRRSGGAGDWTSYFGAIGNSYLVLNSTSASATSASFMNNTAPTSSVFTVGDPTWWSQSPFIAYCFAEVKGFSKAFFYTGNGSSDGVFVNLGFKPAFIMIKASSTTGNWFMQDITRNNNFNGDPKTLQANNTSSESTIGTWGIDLLSNGFKVRESNVGVNGSGSTYIGIAFASNPFVSSKGIPTCAV